MNEITALGISILVLPVGFLVAAALTSLVASSKPNEAALTGYAVLCIIFAFGTAVITYGLLTP